MANSLSEDLLAAQDNENRYPLVEIKASQFRDDIPLCGQKLDAETLDQANAAALTLASGRIVALYTQDYENDTALYPAHCIKLIYTDEERIEFKYATLIEAPNLSGKFSEIAAIEMDDGRVAIVFVYYYSSKYYLKVATFNYDGSNVEEYVLLSAQSLKIYSPSIVRTTTGYLVTYVQDIVITAISGGTYIGVTDSVYELIVLSDGTQTTSAFKWRKDEGAWSDAITMTGIAQILSDGVSVNFKTGDYWTEQNFWFNVTAQKYASGKIVMKSQPEEQDKVVVGASTYTFVNTFTNPTIKNEVLIDPLGMEVTLENLRCAIVAGFFEGSGEGVRYSTGTLANTSATAERDDLIMTLTAIVAGTSGNSISLTVDGVHLNKESFSGGVAASTGALEWMPSNKLYIKRVTLPSGAWSVASVPSIPSTIVTRKKLDTCLFKQSDGSIWLFFTYLTSGSNETSAVYNLMYSKSTDDGVSWSPVVSLTSFTTSSEIARRPAAIQKLATEIMVAYDNVRTSLTLDKKSAYWTDEANQACKYVQFNPANRKLYVVYGHVGAGTKCIYGIVRIDVDTWSIDKYWNGNTVPSIPLIFRENHVIKFSGVGDIITWAISDGYIGLLDGAANTIKIYALEDNSSYALTCNVSNVPWSSKYHFEKIGDIAIDASNHQIYFAFANFGNSTNVKIYKMDYEAEPPAMQEFCSFICNILSTYEEAANAINDRMYLDLENGFLIYCTQGSLSYYAWHGTVRIFMLNGGGLYKWYRYGDDMPNFPFIGAVEPHIINNTLYLAQISYTTEYSQSNLWGLFSVNLTNDAFAWHTPGSVIAGGPQAVGFGTFKSVKTEAGRLIYSSYFGIVIYDTETDKWALINNDTTPGVFPSGYTDFGMTLAYDEAGELIFGGVKGALQTFTGIVAFPISGKIEQTQYFSAQYSGENWDFGPSSSLVKGKRDYDITLAIDPTTKGIYGFWTRWDSKEGQQLAWDKESGELDLTSGLVVSEAIQQVRTIDMQPGKLSFMLEKGHLYDPQNRASLLSRYLKKGKKITLRWGEKVAGEACWQNGRAVYIITGTKMSYKRGTYPTITVSCEDIRTLWDQIGITASSYYSGITPDAVLSDLLQSFAQVAQTDMDFSALAAIDAVYYQYIDTDVKAAVETICDRYGYFIDVSVEDNVLRARRINANNEVSHAYASAKGLIEFTPDDSYSSFTNRVTVTGEGREDLEIQTEEESLASENGTLGFFCCEQIHKIYYSEDKQLRAVNPRLEITQDTASIGFKMAGKMKTYISSVDIEGHWVEVTSKGPSLIPVFLGGLALFITGKNMPPVMTSGGAAESKTGARMKDAGMWIMLQCLAAVGNYAFTVYASPIGQVRQTFQASADDTDMQNELRGTVIETVIEEPLVYDVSQAQKVASYELWVVQSQRNRVKFVKPVHLQDDVGDTITIPHPYTGQTQKILITNLKRSMTIGKEWTDSIEGWLL